MHILAGLTQQGMGRVISSTKFIRNLDKLISKAVGINQEFMNAKWGWQDRPFTMAEFRSSPSGVTERGDGEVHLHMARHGAIHQPLVIIAADKSGLSVHTMIYNINSENQVDSDTIGTIPWRGVTDIVGAMRYSVLKDSKWLRIMDARMSRNAVEDFYMFVINNFLN